MTLAPSTDLLSYIQQKNKKVIGKVLQTFQELLSVAGYGSIATAVKPIRQFYKAEKYHQDYIANPNGYCPDHPQELNLPREKQRQHLIILSCQVSILSSLKQKGIAHIAGVKFRAQVAKNYLGDITLVFRLAKQLQGLTIKSPTWATQQFYF